MKKIAMFIVCIVIMLTGFSSVALAEETYVTEDKVSAEQEESSETEMPEVEKITLEDYQIVLEADEYEFTGKEIQPVFGVKDSEGNSLSEVHYEVSYADNVNVGTGIIEVSGIGDYAGTIRKKFTITAKDIRSLSVIIEKTTMIYTGKALNADIVIRHNNSLLVKNQDYTVKYSSNINIGTATAVVKGFGNYCGEVTRTYRIKALEEMKMPTAKPANGVIRISWTKLSNASGYQVFRSTSENGTYTLLKTIWNNKTFTYDDKKVTNGVTYYYKVRAFRTIGGKHYFTQYTKPLKQRSQVAQVTGMNAVGYTYNAVKITWNKVSGASGYGIFRSTSVNGPYTRLTLVNAKSASYIDKQVVCGQPYYYKVYAYKTTNGKGYYGQGSTPDVGHPLPLRSEFTSQTIPSKTAVTLKWTKSAGAKGYAIYRDSGEGYEEIKAINNANTLSWTDTGLDPEIEYKYKIRAFTIVNNKRVYSYSYSAVYVRELGGWKYVNGYKLYFNNKGEVVQDVSNLIGKQSSYVLKINRSKDMVTVYAKDGENGYIIPVKAFICSDGNGTPTGTFYTPAKYRWRELMGPSWGQWCTRITGGILFHSVYYNSYNDKYDLSVSAYNMLGQTASHGCIRLTSRDAKWIYDNCPLKTKVIIYNSSSYEPLQKPTSYKLPSWHTWDPTDPTQTRCAERGCH